MTGPGVHVLRTLADTERLRSELHPGRRLVIVGAGFVGTEVASTALTLGLDVTLIDTGRVPFERMLGADVGRFLAAHYRAHGIDLRLQTRVARLHRQGGGALRAIALSAGHKLPCDLILVAAGAEPAAELVSLPSGIPTDEIGRFAVSGVYACGDAAVPWQPALAGHFRLEHWTSAAHQAANVARAILGRHRGVPHPLLLVRPVRTQTPGGISAGMDQRCRRRPTALAGGGLPRRRRTPRRRSARQQTPGCLPTPPTTCN